MATDMLNRRLAEYGGSFSTDDILLTFPGLQNAAAFVPFIISQLGINYGQQISRIYGLNLSKVFLVSGRAQGNAALQQILAPQGNLNTFYQTYGDACNANKNVMQFSLRTGCGQGASGFAQRFLAGMCLANQLAINTAAEQGVVNNSTQISFESLEYTQSA